MEYFSTQKTSLGPLWVRNYSQESYSDLYHICLLVLPVFMLHINGLIWYVLFCPWQFSLNIMSMRTISVVEYVSEWNEVKLLSRVWLSATLWTVAYQAPPSMGFSRQGYWSGLPFPSPGIFLTQGSNPGLPHCGQTLYGLSHQGSPVYWYTEYISSPFFLKIVLLHCMNIPQFI